MVDTIPHPHPQQAAERGRRTLTDHPVRRAADGPVPCLASNTAQPAADEGDGVQRHRLVGSRVVERDDDPRLDDRGRVVSEGFPGTPTGSAGVPPASRTREKSSEGDPVVPSAGLGAGGPSPERRHASPEGAEPTSSQRDDRDQWLMTSDGEHRGVNAALSLTSRRPRSAGPHSAAISSRPISIRRISEVPAPISISLASRKRRDTGESLRKPAPPIACTAWWACVMATSEQ